MQGRRVGGEESQITAKGVAFYGKRNSLVPIDGKRSPIATPTRGVPFPLRRSPVCRAGTPF